MQSHASVFVYMYTHVCRFIIQIHTHISIRANCQTSDQGNTNCFSPQLKNIFDGKIITWDKITLVKQMKVNKKLV